MKQLLASWWRDDDGLTTVEYALLLGLVVVVAAAGWENLGETLANSADEPIEVMQTSRSDG